MPSVVTLAAMTTRHCQPEPELGVLGYDLVSGGLLTIGIRCGSQSGGELSVPVLRSRRAPFFSHSSRSKLQLEIKKIYGRYYSELSPERPLLRGFWAFDARS